MITNNNDYISFLPRELVSDIMNRCQLHDAIAFLNTCKRYNQNNYFWQQQLFQQYGITLNNAEYAQLALKSIHLYEKYKAAKNYDKLSKAVITFAKLNENWTSIYLSEIYLFGYADKADLKKASIHLVKAIDYYKQCRGLKLPIINKLADTIYHYQIKFTDFIIDSELDSKIFSVDNTETYLKLYRKAKFYPHQKNSNSAGNYDKNPSTLINALDTMPIKNSYKFDAFNLIKPLAIKHLFDFELAFLEFNSTFETLTIMVSTQSKSKNIEIKKSLDFIKKLTGFGLDVDSIDKFQINVDLINKFQTMEINELDKIDEELTRLNLAIGKIGEQLTTFMLALENLSNNILYNAVAQKISTIFDNLTRSFNSLTACLLNYRNLLSEINFIFDNLKNNFRDFDNIMLELYERLAEDNVAHAIHSLIDIYEYGFCSISQNKEKSNVYKMLASLNKQAVEKLARPDPKTSKKNCLVM